MSFVKNCVVCGALFETNHPNIITCSPECSLENRHRKAKAYRLKTVEEKQKKIYNKVCRICGKSFQTFKACQVICSSECRLEAERQRQARYERKKREQRAGDEKEAEQELTAVEIQEEVDHRYDWLKKFSPILKDAMENGCSYGKIVANQK